MKIFHRYAIITVFSFCLVAIANAAEYKSIGLKIAGMSCSACAEKVQTSLNKVEGVKEAIVTLTTSTAKVVYDPSKTDENALKGSVKAAGYSITEIKAWDKTMTSKAEASEKAGCCGGVCTDKAAKKKSI